jgi:hypothetical protein
MMIARSKINLGEYPGSCKLIEQNIDLRKRILILDVNLIEGSIVHAHS